VYDFLYLEYSNGMRRCSSMLSPPSKQHSFS